MSPPTSPCRVPPAAASSAHRFSSGPRERGSRTPAPRSQRSIALPDEAFEHFFDEGLIEQVLKPLKHGKEASVHLCRANPRTTGGESLAVLKRYHPLNRRDFRDETLYRDGEY